MDVIPSIVFVCPHGAAKSVVAAVVQALLAEGIDPSDHRPRAVTHAELAVAERWDDVAAFHQDPAAAFVAALARGKAAS